jgi:serine/threonine protein kinase
MQCFQKDPNLRVSARKLLKHPWIVNARRSDSVIATNPPKYDEAVKSVQQWNAALKSPDSNSLRRQSRQQSSSPIPTRLVVMPTQAAPAVAHNLLPNKPRVTTEAFQSPVGAGMHLCHVFFFADHADIFANLSLQRMITGTMTLLLQSPQAPSTSLIYGLTITLADCSRLRS